MKSSRETRGENKKEAIQDAQKEGEKLSKAFTEISGKVATGGAIPKDAMGISNSYLENVYAQAYRLYNTGKYDEATHLFRILIMLNPMEPKYMLGLAACFHMLKEFNNAIQTYTMCSAVDAQTPIPHYHSSDCYIQMKDYLSAMISLELAVDRAGDKPEFAKLKERSQMSLESLKKQAIAST